jgi:hypothetical protein
MATKGLTAFTPEVDCDQTAMGLAPCLRGMFEMPLLLLRIKCERYVRKINEIPK